MKHGGQIFIFYSLTRDAGVRSRISDPAAVRALEIRDLTPSGGRRRPFRRRCG
jgi:hypothetical protein